MFGDPTLFITQYHDDLIREAAQARIADQLEHRGSTVRHDLALACHRLADWLDGSNQYPSASDSGPSGWVRGLTRP
jgi:hypothetical protein